MHTENAFIAAAKQRVQFVAPVYGYEYVTRAAHDEEIGWIRSATLHWVGDIFNTPEGSIYVPLDKGLFDLFYFDPETKIDTADPRLVEYEFKYACNVIGADPIDEPPTDISHGVDPRTLPQSLFQYEDHWYMMRAMPMDPSILPANKLLQSDIAIVRQMGDLNAYSPMENEGFLNRLSSSGFSIPPVLPVSPYWDVDGILGDGLMLKTDSGWREVFVDVRANEHNETSYYSLQQRCCVRTRIKMGSPHVYREERISLSDIKTLLGYYLDTKILPSLVSDREHAHIVHYDKSLGEEFRLEALTVTGRGEKTLFISDQALGEEGNWLTSKMAAFPVNAQKEGDGSISVMIDGANGFQSRFDRRTHLGAAGGKLDAERYESFLRETFEHPRTPEFRALNQLRVDVVM